MISQCVGNISTVSSPFTKCMMMASDVTKDDSMNRRRDDECISSVDQLRVFLIRVAVSHLVEVPCTYVNHEMAL